MIKIDYTKGEEYVSSGVKTADALITDELGKLGAVWVMTNGNNDASLTVYDNQCSEVSGVVLAKGTVPSADRLKNILPVRVPYGEGLYCDVGGEGASYIIYFRNENLFDRIRAASFTKAVVFETAEPLKALQELKSARFDALDCKKISIFILSSASGVFQFRQSINGKEWGDLQVEWDIPGNEPFFKVLNADLRWLQLHYKNGDLPAKIFRAQALASN